MRAVLGFWVLIVLFFILSCNQHEKELLTEIHEKVKFEASELNRPIDSISSTISGGNLFIKFSVKDQWIDEEDNTAFLVYLSHKIYPQISVFDTIAIVLLQYSITPTRTFFISGERDRFKKNHLLMKKYPEYPELLAYTFSKMSRREVFLCNYYIDFAPKLMPEYDFKGTYWELLGKFTTGCVDNDIKKIFWFKSLAGMMLAGDSGVDEEHVLHLLNPCGFKKQDVHMDSIAKEYHQIYNSTVESLDTNITN